MKRTLLAFSFLATAATASAQSANDAKTFTRDSATIMSALTEMAPAPTGTKTTAVLESGDAMEVYTSVEQQPQFPGDLQAHLVKNLVYPTGARKAGASGRAIVRFIITADGTILSPQVVRTTGNAELDAEASRVVRAMPAWKPAMQGGQAVPVYFHLPISFQLEN